MAVVLYCVDKLLIVLVKSAQAAIILQDTSSVLKEEHVTAFEDERSYIMQDQQDQLVCRGILDLEETDMPEPLAPESYPESICEEDVTLALKELDERCEEEEADFPGLSRCACSQRVMSLCLAPLLPNVSLPHSRL